jgi:hypothetical protein
LLIDFVQPATGDAAINVPASTFRMAFAALAGLTGEGVLAPATAVVTQRGAGANFSVDIQPFQAVVRGEDVTDQGSYLVTNTAVFNLATPAAPGSGTRTHRLVAQVRDKRANATWTTYDWTPVIVTDTGSGEPAEPPSSETLAHITIASGQANVSNGNITQGGTILRNLNILGPWSSFQAGAGSWNATNNWTDFSAGNWPPVTFTVPPSGQVFVTVSASPNVSIGSGGNAFVGYRVSGTDTRGADSAFAVGGASGIHQGSCRHLFTALTPGGTDTITPAWFLSPAGAGTGSDGGNGQIIVEAVQ